MNYEPGWKASDLMSRRIRELGELAAFDQADLPNALADYIGAGVEQLGNRLTAMNAAANAYKALTPSTISGTTDSPTTGTRRTYTNAGAVAVTLDATFADGGESLLIKGSGSGAITISPGGGFTINGGAGSMVLKSIASVLRAGTDFLILGGTDAIKDFDGSAVRNFLASIKDETGTTYTCLLEDSGKTINFVNASPITVTLPNTLPEGWGIQWHQQGGGQITFSPAANVTLRHRQTHTKSFSQYATGGLSVYDVSAGNRFYLLSGDTAA